MDLKIRLDEDEVYDVPMGNQEIQPQAREPSFETDDKLKPQLTPRPWRISLYQPYFEVDSISVLSRLLRTITPTCEGDFFSGSSPDLYAPFWIICTLVLIVGITSSLENSLDTGSWKISLTKVAVAGVLLFGIIALVPLASYFALKHTGTPVEYVKLLSLYGYSFSLFIPALILCIVPIKVYQVFVMVGTTIWSLSILAKNFWNEVVEVYSRRKIIVAAVMTAGHACFLITCLLYFF